MRYYTELLFVLFTLGFFCFVQVANKILEVLLKLRELGYPSHLEEIAKDGLKCNNKEADRMVSVSLYHWGK